MNRLAIEFLGYELNSPLVLPSGVSDFNPTVLKTAVESGAGIVTSKSLTLEPRKGNDPPVTFELGNNNLMGRVGLKNPGIIEGLKIVEEYKRLCSSPIIVSVFGITPDDFAKLSSLVNNSKADFIELNVSCPNVGNTSESNLDNIADIVSTVKNISRVPVIIKLSPNVESIVNIAITAEQQGVDAITLINALGPGMNIDIRTREIFEGGISGPSIKPIAIKSVYEVRKQVKIPIIGLGGVSTGEDVIEFMIAGANLVGVGAYIFLKGITAFSYIQQEIIDYLNEVNTKSISEINLRQN